MCAISGNKCEHDVSLNKMAPQNMKMSQTANDAAPKQPVTYSMAKWVYDQVISSASCMSRAQGSTYASSAVDAPEIKRERSQSETRTPASLPDSSAASFLEVPEAPMRERANSDSRISRCSKKPNEDSWKWMSFGGRVKIRSADLNVFAPQTM